MTWYVELVVGYWTLVAIHLLIQMFFAHLEYRKSIISKKTNGQYSPDLSVIIAVFNENPQILEKCFLSMSEQKYSGELEILVVDDSSANFEDLRPVYKKFADKYGFKVILSKENKGKRESQVMAVNKARGEILVTIDCDTILVTENEITNIVKKFKDKTVGAVSGVVGVENKKTNLLTELIDYRYWSAFYLERAAQSYFGKVLCCSGPFSAYRKSVFEKVKERYTGQYFLGKKCTYGDDRHLTNLFLDEEYRVCFEPIASATTYVPEKIGPYLKQQRRWSKSFYRELLWTPRSVWGGERYLVYDLVTQISMPFLLLGSLAVVLWSGWLNLLWFLLMMASVSGIRLTYGVYRTKDWRFLRFVLYDFVHVLLLIPNRLLALVTLKDNRWGTR